VGRCGCRQADGFIMDLKEVGSGVDLVLFGLALQPSGDIFMRTVIKLWFILKGA